MKKKESSHSFRGWLELNTTKLIFRALEKRRDAFVRDMIDNGNQEARFHILELNYLLEKDLLEQDLDIGEKDEV